MKLANHSSRAERNSKGFTLMEVLVVMATSVLLIGIVLGTHLYGLRMSTRTQVKLSASDDARKTISLMMEDIRSAKSLRVGTGSETHFTDADPDAYQVGDAIQIYRSSDTNDWIRYFYDSENNTLKRTMNGETASLVTANSVTNSHPIFTEQNFQGITLTNRTPVAVVEVNLSFTKLTSPQVQIGPGNYFDFYQLQTRISPRVRL
jgi:type II secretory pathway pseudopilin PulG